MSGDSGVVSMSYVDLIRALQGLTTKEQAGELAYLGWVVNNVYTIPVANEPGMVWVRIERGQTRSVDRARNLKAPLIPDLPVRVAPGKNNPNELEVIDLDSSAWTFLGTDAPGITSPHSHEPGFGMEDPVSARRMKMGLVHATNPLSLSVYIEPFHYVYEGEGKYWPGGALDLTSFVPATAGTWSWIKVGINPISNVAVAVTGTAYSFFVPLSEDLLAAVAFDGYLSLAGVKLRAGQTLINNEWDFADCTPWRSGITTAASWLKHNLAASAAPGVDDDSTDGYGVGSRWLDTTGEKEYVCTSASIGAAVWVETTGGGGGGAFTDLSDVPAAYTGAAGKVVAVNVGESALEFVDPATGTGDMTKAVYDADLDNVVDNAAALNGHADTYFATASHTHDDRYFTESEHLAASAGAGDAGKPIKLNASGLVDDTMLPAIGGAITVQEQDGVPTVADVTTIKVTNGTLTDEGGGVVSINTGGGAGAPRMVIFTFSGDLAVGASPFRIYNPLGVSVTISKVFLAASTAPTGAAIIADIHKDATTIFTNQAHRPQIAAAANTGETTTIDVATWAAGEYLTAEIDQIGSGTAGANLVVHIVYS